MTMFDQLKRDQLKEQIQKIQKFKNIRRPKAGWIRTMRELYGMSLAFVAKKVGVVRSRVGTVEICESQDRITLATLRLFADTLNCDLVYALIPREDPEKFLEKHAQQKADIMIAQLKKTMDLENQSISEKELNRHHAQLIEELMRTPKKIWEGQ